MKTKSYSALTTAAVLFCWATLVVTTMAQHEGHGGQKPPAQEPQQQGARADMSAMMPNHLLAMAYLQNMTIFARLLRDQVQRDNAVNGAFARDVTAELRRSFDQVERYHQQHMDTMQAESGTQAGAMMDHSSMRASGRPDEPSEFKALREIGAERGAITPPSPAVQNDARSKTADQSGGHAHSQTNGQMNNQMAEMMRQMEACLAQLSAHLIELERETGAANPNPKWVLEHTNTILKFLDEMTAMRCGGQASK